MRQPSAPWEAIYVQGGGTRDATSTTSKVSSLIGKQLRPIVVLEYLRGHLGWYQGADAPASCLTDVSRHANNIDAAAVSHGQRTSAGAGICRWRDHRERDNKAPRREHDQADDWR